MNTNKRKIRKSAASLVLSILMILSVVIVAPADVADSTEFVTNTAETIANDNIDTQPDDADMQANKDDSLPDESSTESSRQEQSPQEILSVSAKNDQTADNTAAEKADPVSIQTLTAAPKSLPQTSGDEDSSEFTIYLKNTRNWISDGNENKINAHLWNDSGETTQWPGVQMTDVGNGIFKAVLTGFSSTPQHVIFNQNGAGSSQTNNRIEKNIDINTYGHMYNPEDNVWEYYNPKKASTGQAARTDAKFLYGLTNNPKSMINSLPIMDQKYNTDDSSSEKYFYIDFTPTLDQDYYFTISGSLLYSNMYRQGSSEVSWDFGSYDTSHISVNGVTYDKIDNRTYRFVHFKVIDKSVERVRICFPSQDGSDSIYLGEKFWFVENPEEVKDEVAVYAKSGTIRESGVKSDKYSKLADTTLSYADSGDGTLTVQYDYYKYKDSSFNTQSRLALAKVPRGKTIRVTTTLHSGYKDKYYVKAFVINGDTFNVIEQSEANSSTGVYTCDYTIPEDINGNVEITPVYYYFVNEQNKDDFVTFSVEDFHESAKSLWGNTIACYAYYTGADDSASAESENKPALGGYPGQPMVYINGSYYMQIPKIGENNGPIEGITLNNYVWDDVHVEAINGLTGSLDSVTKLRKKINCQTYDYDDFTALCQRNTDKVVFRFQYRTYNNSISVSNGELNTTEWEKGNEPSSATTDLGFVDSANGWNVLTDYYGYPVDLFARRITNSETSDDYITEGNVNSLGAQEKVYVVSDGYEAYYYGDNAENKYLGQYGTKWYVYKYNGSSYEYIGALPPSAFLTGLNSDKDVPVQKGSCLNKVNDDSSVERFLNYSANSISYKNAHNEMWTNYQNIYNACASLPVVITYESSIYSAGASGTTQNIGYRCDGRWYYSVPAATVSVNTKIMIIDKDTNGNVVYNPNGTLHYSEDEYETPTNVNSHIGQQTSAYAYLNNDTPTDVNGESFK